MTIDRRDCLLALGVLLAGVPEHVSDPRALLFSAALAASLLVRRRAPFAVLLALAAVAFGQWLAGVSTMSDLALLVALYTVALHETRTRTAVAAAILELGAVLAARTDGGYRAFVGLSALAVAAGVLGRGVRHRRELFASLEDRAAAAERARIARELHDIVAHNLTVMVALADGAVYAAERRPEQATAAMQTVSDTGRAALAEMRRLLGVLREDEGSARVPQPGISQIDELVEQVRAAGLPVTLEVAGDGRALPAGAQLTVFRLVQEALTNTLKHAGASAAARVRLRYGADAVEVEVTDSGTVLAAPAAHAGRGLEGMRERASVYAGTVEAGPGANGGWRVHAHLRLGQATP